MTEKLPEGWSRDATNIPDLEVVSSFTGPEVGGYVQRAWLTNCNEVCVSGSAPLEVVATLLRDAGFAGPCGRCDHGARRRSL